MSVFKIQQQGVKTQADVEKSEEKPEEAVASPEQTTPDEGEKHNMKVGVDVAANPGDADAGEKPEVMVKIDGPVSRVFTDALDKLLATESYMTMLPMDESDLKDDGDFIQVYAWKASELNAEDVTQITNEISKHTSRNFIIAVEDATVITPIMGVLGSLTAMKNVKVCYTRNRALQLVQEKITK